jgi:hypothetical protein
VQIQKNSAMLTPKPVLNLIKYTAGGITLTDKLVIFVALLCGTTVRFIEQRLLKKDVCYGDYLPRDVTVQTEVDGIRARKIWRT